MNDECPAWGCVIGFGFSCDGSSGTADCSGCPCCKDGSCRDRRLSDEEKKQLGEHLDVDEKVLIPLRILSNAIVPQLDLSSPHLIKERILSNPSSADVTQSTVTTEAYKPDRKLNDECPIFSCDGTCGGCPCCKDGSCRDRRLSDEIIPLII